MAETNSEQSLEELKAEVKLDESTDFGSSENTDEKSVDETKEDDPKDENLDGEDSKNDSWMESDSHESEDVEKEKKYTGTDIGKAKHKATVKAERKSEAEIERLKNELEEYKRNPAAPTNLGEPTRESFEDSYGDVNEPEYIKALTKYWADKNQAEAQAKSIGEAEQAKLNQERGKIEQSVLQHYDRLEKLADDSDISDDVIRGADLRVRQAVDSVFPDSGDIITDNFIAKLGEGSEKVISNLGLNKSRLSEFTEKLRNDTSGGEAFVFLGKLSGELSNQSKRKTNAHAPAAKPTGDMSSKSAHSYETAVDKAFSDGDLQKAYDLRSQAKAAGVKLKKLV